MKVELQGPLEPILIYVTCPDMELAKAIARVLLEQRLIACANILPQMQSIYSWQGEIKEDSEVVLLLKTRQDLSPDVTQKVVSLHSYDCPAVLEIPLRGGHPEFLAWIQAETESKKTNGGTDDD